MGDMTGASNPTLVAHWGESMGSQGVRLGRGGVRQRINPSQWGAWLAHGGLACLHQNQQKCMGPGGDGLTSVSKKLEPGALAHRL